jgi:starvation-inducible DNA-binding protein
MASKKTQTPEIDIGIAEGEREKIVKGLSALLADSYTLYLMTHNFHWNVTGPQFNSLHAMFMAQYTEQWNGTRPDCRAHPRAGFPRAGHLQGVRQAGVDQGGRGCAQGQRDDPPSGRSPGSHGANCTQVVSGG